jgi:hypothetical protein
MVEPTDPKILKATSRYFGNLDASNGKQRMGVPAAAPMPTLVPKPVKKKDFTPIV